MDTKRIIQNQSARQAIVTRYHGPTTTRGARITASSTAGKITLPYDYAGEAYDNHCAAAIALAKKTGWEGSWVGGAAPISAKDSYYFCKMD